MQNSSSDSWRVLGQAFLGITLTALFFYTMAPFMIALVIGAVIAILCEPLYERLRRLLPNGLAALTVTGVVTAGILAPLTFVGISMTLRLSELLRGIKLPNLGDLQNLSENPAVVRLLRQIPAWLPIDRAWAQEQSLTVLQRVLEKSSELLGAFITGLPGVLLGFVIVIVAAYFFMVDGQRFARFLSSISPLPVDKSRELFNAFSQTCRGVVLSMFAGAAAQGFLVGFFFAITGIPNPLLWGFIGVIMGMVPLIGTAPVLIGGVVYHLAHHQTGSMVVVIIGSVLVGFSDNVVRPWVLKGHGEMHPLLGLVSAFGAVTVLGPMGIILGPLIAALFVALLEILSADQKKQFTNDHTIVTSPTSKG